MSELLADLSVVRKGMLRMPLLMDLDKVISANAVSRCMIIATVINKIARSSDGMKSLVETNGIIKRLKEEAIGRNSGVIKNAPSLITGEQSCAQKELKVV